MRFVLTTKGARILLSLKSASEELQPVLEEAKGFSPLSFKVANSSFLTKQLPHKYNHRQGRVIRKHKHLRCFER